MKSTVSEKGQITIPKLLRQRLGIRAGDVLELSEDAGRLVVWAEVSAGFPEPRAAHDALDHLGIGFSALDPPAAEGRERRGVRTGGAAVVVSE